jgi:hypothetical protein
LRARLIRCGLPLTIALAAICAWPRDKIARDPPTRVTHAPPRAPRVYRADAAARELTLLPAPPHEIEFFAGLVSKESATPASLDEPSKQCPADMIEVEGDYCPYVEQRCLRWIDYYEKPPLMCAEFAPTSRCFMPTQHEHFCIDRYEWPNQKGALPAFSLNWFEARNSCLSIGKRLCLDNEWTLACEGEERLPYPYGYLRNDDACNIDKPYRTPNAEKYIALETREAELEKLDQREPCGSRESCVSPYGVHDMAGNVDEWVVNETGRHEPHISGLKGGYWGPVRTRCRPMTIIHDEWFHYYQVGFRCCADTTATP